MKFLKKNKVDPDKIVELSKRCKISTILSEMLLSRGIDSPEKANKYLYGTIDDFESPFLFPQMEKIVEIIREALSGSQKIVVYGDYDCDGVGAIAILTLAFQDNGYRLHHYIPTRSLEGYGLNKNAIRYISDTYKPDLLITVDCGINSIEEVRFAKELGMQVIITDHHTPSDVLPDCPILNPFLTQNASPLCGAGVVFKLVSALFGLEFALKYIDICALSTIADIVPLTGDNRLIVKLGMDAIKKGHCRPGIKELLYSSKTDLKSLTTSDVGFKIAPRINAAGRLSSAELSLSVLLEDDTTALHMIADQLSLLNTERQEKNAKIFEEAMETLKQYDFAKYRIIILQGEWEEGIVGIVCAKLVEYFNLPAILVCKQEGKTVLKGSARSIPGINLYELFDKNNSHLVSYGGHEMAAGISFESENLQIVLDELNDYILNNIEKSVFEKKFYYDAELPVNAINQSILSELNLMEPFGHKNAKPIFLDRTSSAKFKQIGQTRHVKAKYSMGDLVAFDKFSYAEITKNNKYSFSYTTEKNYFNGKITNQFMVKDWEFDTFEYTPSQLLENFYKTFVGTKTEEIATYPEIKDIPDDNRSLVLLVTYDANKVPHLLKQYPSFKKEVFNQSGCALTNVIAFSPDDTFPFEYYQTIYFKDRPGEYLIKKIYQSKKNVVISPEKIRLDPVSLEEMRSIYLALRNLILPNKRFVSANKLFEDIHPMSIHDEKKRTKFLLGFYILYELGLVKITKDDIIEILNVKVDITKSKLYQYVNR